MRFDYRQGWQANHFRLDANFGDETNTKTSSSEEGSD
jgi:hypothetical protein